MAEADETDLRGVEQFCDGVAYFRKHATKPRVEQQWLVVLDEKMIELEIGPRGVYGNPLYIRSDLGDGQALRGREH